MISYNEPLLRKNLSLLGLSKEYLSHLIEKAVIEKQHCLYYSGVHKIGRAVPIIYFNTEKLDLLHSNRQTFLGYRYDSYKSLSAEIRRTNPYRTKGTYLINIIISNPTNIKRFSDFQEILLSNEKERSTFLKLLKK